MLDSTSPNRTAVLAGFQTKGLNRLRVFEQSQGSDRGGSLLGLWLPSVWFQRFPSAGVAEFCSTAILHNKDA